jgi:hypothetical protein
MDRHPLLTDELLLVKRPLEREQKDQQPTTEREPQSEDLAEEVDSLGSLCVLFLIRSVTCSASLERYLMAVVLPSTAPPRIHG